MANRYYSIYLGQDKTAAVEAASTVSAADVEVRITYTATGLTQGEVLKCLEQLEARIKEDTWPPA
ncbi:MAG: hypothetical protein RLZZ373_2680 [Pseudomonadota bacterium]|jgi:hypothetical protein